MTLKLNEPDVPQLERSRIETIETEAPPVTFNTSYYEQAHGKPPHHATKGTWQFVPPRHLGKRPFVFHDMTYAEAKKQAEAAFNERPRYGEFILTP